MKQFLSSYWSISTQEILSLLHTSYHGLSSREVKKRLQQSGYNILKSTKKINYFVLFLTQFQSPLILILIASALLSISFKETSDAVIILSIVCMSALLGFWQEKDASKAVQTLVDNVQNTSLLLRDSKAEEIPTSEIVPGDIVMLTAGDSIPADAVVLESKNLFVNEATLTGETYPVDKKNGIVPIETPLAQRKNCLFMGTHVVSGSAKAVIVKTGKETELGEVSEHMKLKPPETEFERGIRKFSNLLIKITSLMVLAIFVINIYFSRPVFSSFMFALALAVGLIPELLPAIISINLAQGAKRMAQKKVIVKKLSSIENFGSMNILCADKTGTLTEGIVTLYSALNVAGKEDEKVLLYAYLNAFYETGFKNPMDDAIRTFRTFDVSMYHKLDEIPYDFLRKRLSILVSTQGTKTSLMITKGAFKEMLSICSTVELPNKTVNALPSYLEKIQHVYEMYSKKGFRTLGLACKNLASNKNLKKDDERDMTFLGLLIFYDPPKKGIIPTVQKLKDFGITLKIITGDTSLVAIHLAKKIGLKNQKIITGQELTTLSDEALIKKVHTTDIFTEIEPNQKERIILALRKLGHVTGYLGDGINDASALHAADVGISVDSAVDVAKESADIVLLEKNLNVLFEGINEGRHTFVNTLKYIFITTSANFGNMFSMAGLSLFISFLPLLPKQILLNNFLSDFPAMTIASDSVDIELIKKPRHWNIKFIQNFMLIFGLISSCFDYLTFATLLFVLKVSEIQFRTGWFIESLMTELVIIFVIRTKKNFYASKPGKYLLFSAISVGFICLFLPYTALGTLLGFAPLSFLHLLTLMVITVLYFFTNEITKKWFFKKLKF